MVSIPPLIYRFNVSSLRTIPRARTAIGIIIIIIRVFHNSMLVSHWRDLVLLSNTNSPYLSRTLLSIQDDFNVVVRIAMILPLIFDFFSFFSKPLETISSAPTTTGITATFKLHSFFSTLARSTYSFIFSPSVASQNGKIYNIAEFNILFSFFLQSFTGSLSKT